MKQLLFILFVFSTCSLWAQHFPAKPNPPKLVNDFTSTISTTDVQALEQKLVAFDNATSNQVTVVIISSTDGAEITDYATQLGRQWGIGNKDKNKNNGVLLLVAKNDRKLTIVVGYGLEGAVPDAVAQSIIDNDIKPYFKQGDFFGGIDNGTDAIIKATQGAYTASEGYANRGQHKNDGGSTAFFVILFIVIAILVILKNNNGGGGGGMMSRRGYRDIGNFPIIFPGGGWSGGGGNSSGGGGGGFGGFGGGSFGGGGASGSW